MRWWMGATSFSEPFVSYTDPRALFLALWSPVLSGKKNERVATQTLHDGCSKRRINELPVNPVRDNCILDWRQVLSAAALPSPLQSPATTDCFFYDTSNLPASFSTESSTHGFVVQTRFECYFPLVISALNSYAKFGRDWNDEEIVWHNAWKRYVPWFLTLCSDRIRIPLQLV